MQSFIDIPPKFRMMIVFIISMLAANLVFRPILNISKQKGIVDNPDARKLQKEPIPILGGAAVFFGIMMGITFFKTWYNYVNIFPVISAMVMMLYIGIIDDIVDIKPKIRFALEILISLLLIFGTHRCITNFQGLWGIENVSIGLGIVLSVITFVGLVNAYNMIDGIDGLSSSLGIQICIFFSIIFFIAHDYAFSALSVVTMAALVPFFLHNVFGWSSKMFIGDGGTMVIGTMFAAMVFETLSSKFGGLLTSVTDVTVKEGFARNLSLIAFCLAVFSLPIADTLRVMTERIAHKKSPFSADNIHLHHLFVRNGYSYIGTTIRENILNLSVIAIFAALWLCGASLEWQLYGTVLSAFAANIITASVLRYCLSHPERSYSRFISRCAQKSHVERKGIWLKIQKIVDRKINEKD